MNPLSVRTPAPWYREPWPWLLMAGPAIVVVAGSFTMVLAITTSDGVVADDYYRQGLAVNREIERTHAGEQRQLHGAVRYDAAGQGVVADLAAADALPAVVRITFSHPARAIDDVVLDLTRAADGLYRGNARLPPGTHLNVKIEGADWLVTAVWKTTVQPLALGAP